MRNERFHQHWYVNDYAVQQGNGIWNADNIGDDYKIPKGEAGRLYRVEIEVHWSPNSAVGVYFEGGNSELNGAFSFLLYGAPAAAPTKPIANPQKRVLYCRTLPETWSWSEDGAVVDAAGNNSTQLTLTITSFDLE